MKTQNAELVHLSSRHQIPNLGLENEVVEEVVGLEGQCLNVFWIRLTNQLMGGVEELADQRSGLEEVLAALIIVSIAVETQNKVLQRRDIQNILDTLTVITYSDRPSEATYVLDTVSEDDN